jgi:hypothetical protein
MSLLVGRQLADLRDDLKELCSILVYIGEKGKGAQKWKDDRILDAESLFMRIIFNAHSCILLTSGLEITVLDKKMLHFDPPGIMVLTRSIHEAYLVFNYIFIQSKTEEDCTFKYYCWCCASLYNEVNRMEGLVGLRAEQQKVKGQAEVMLNRIALLYQVKQMERRGRERLIRTLTSGHWVRPPWIKLGEQVGLNSLHSRSMYQYLCGTAHSELGSVYQFRSIKRDTNVALRLVMNAFIHIGIILARLAFDYGGFLQLAGIENALPDSAPILNTYSLIGEK